MRMIHYYSVLAFVLVPALLATLGLGLFHDGSQKHLSMGLVTAILCVATNTLLILFMIVTGRVLRAAMKARPLGEKFLAELNEFFANRRVYPMALVGAASAAATAVLGYGRFIGVPSEVHLLLGLATILINLGLVPFGLRTLRGNQGLLDRAARDLDRIEREVGPAPPEAGEIEWTYGPATRWTVFTLSAWLPYLYWGLVVWRGDFAAVPRAFLIGTAVVSALGALRAWRCKGSPTERV
jgi:hypothetical protein